MTDAPPGGHAGGSDPAADDEALFRALSDRLVDELVAALPGWVEGQVRRIHEAWSGTCPPDVEAAAADAGRSAAYEVGRELRDLLALDIDEQRRNPLSVVRPAVRYPAAVLSDAGVPTVVRDDFERERFPDDGYGLTPAGFADLGDEVGAVGLAWGAAKARLHMRRHR